MTARRAPRRALPAVLAVASLVTAGCTVGPSQRPPVAVRGDGIVGAPAPSAPAPLPSPGSAVLPDPDTQQPFVSFHDCTTEVLFVAPVPVPSDRSLRADCAQLSVPADRDQPLLGRSRLGLIRVGLADAPANRPPLLALGDSATEPSAMHAVVVAAQVPRTVLEHFTLVGFDRRGTGADALDCAPADARAALVDADLTEPAGPATDGALAELLEHARAVVQECHVLLSGGASGFRTASTAADVGELRTALGVHRLSAVGVGDAATALTRWASTAPATVGRLVLDGPPDPAVDEPARTEARARAAEAAFDTFAVVCAARPDCPLGPDPRATVTGLLEQLRGQPLSGPDGRTLRAGGAVTALLRGLGEPRSWPALAGALATARAGDPVELLDLLDPVAGLGGRFDAMLATTCNDTAHRLSPGEIGKLAGDWRTDYPLFGTTLALRLLACAPWPSVADAADSQPGPGTAELPPVLVLGTAHDPRGPLEGSRRAAEGLPTGHFLTWQGSGTGAYPRTACVTEAADRLLVDGIPPTDDIEHSPLCPP